MRVIASRCRSLLRFGTNQSGGNFMLRLGVAACVLTVAACGSKKDWTQGDLCAALVTPLLKTVDCRPPEERITEKEQDRKLWFDVCCTGAECGLPARASRESVDACIAGLAKPTCTSFERVPGAAAVQECVPILKDVAKDTNLSNCPEFGFVVPASNEWCRDARMRLR